MWYNLLLVLEFNTLSNEHARSDVVMDDDGLPTLEVGLVFFSQLELDLMFRDGCIPPYEKRSRSENKHVLDNAA